MGCLLVRRGPAPGLEARMLGFRFRFEMLNVEGVTRSKWHLVGSSDSGSPKSIFYP